MDVLLLWHVHDLEDGYGVHEEVKFIGVFSSESKASSAINQLKDQDGFRDYPLNCFQIHQSEIDQMSWLDGFSTISWTE